jgi:hypothetical protein
MYNYKDHEEILRSNFFTIFPVLKHVELYHVFPSFFIGSDTEKNTEKIKLGHMYSYAFKSIIAQWFWVLWSLCAAQLCDLGKSLNLFKPQSSHL